MKPIKMLGLAMLAALTAMAFVGASSAMAEPTQLCEVDVLEAACPEGKAVTHTHEETLEAKKSILLNSTGSPIECNVLFLSTEVLGLGTLQIIHGHFTYTSCERSGSTCTITEVSKDALILVLREGHELAKVTFHFETNMHCGLLLNCTYKGENLVGHGLGSLLPGEEKLGGVLIDGQTLVKISGLCPEIAELDLTLTPLGDIYIAK
ncbi:MAG: hypothetical protein ACM3N0_04910 [Chloroflexota bacterium]